MNYKYFLPDDGETVADARAITRKQWNRDASTYGDAPVESVSHRHAAQNAAQSYYAKNYSDWSDGEEVAFGIVDDDGAVEVFDVELEFEPTFSASRRRGDAWEARTSPEATPDAQEAAEQA